MCRLTSSMLTVILGGMASSNRHFTRREFIKLAGLGLGAMAIRPLSSRLALFPSRSAALLPDFPKADLLGRNCTTDTSLEWGGIIPIMATPDVGGSKVRDAQPDEVFPWLKEVSAAKHRCKYSQPALGRDTRRLHPFPFPAALPEPPQLACICAACRTDWFLGRSDRSLCGP